MLSVKEAQQTILDNIKVLNPVDQPIIKCLDRIAAENIYAGTNVPNWDSAARDGYAVRAVDITNASSLNPRILKVIDIVGAGSVSRIKLLPGTAIRIMTGATLPEGADCVIQFEDTDEENRTFEGRKSFPEEIGILHEGAMGTNIRPAGDNISKGSPVVAANTLIGPAQIGALTALGYTKIKVFRQPVVSIISTGNELVEPGSPLSISQLYNSNSYNIAAQVQKCGGISKILDIARDNRRSLRARIRHALKSDMIITCGGTSMGDYDLVKEIMADQGRIVFEKVRMAPGMPFAFALVKTDREIPHFALTGNPAAGMVNFEILVRPVIRKMQGFQNIFLSELEAVLTAPVRNKKDTARYIWVKVEKKNGMNYASPTSEEIKGLFPSIMAANGLAVIPEEVSQTIRGDKVKVILLDWLI